jgi:hypothetical protein
MPDALRSAVWTEDDALCVWVPSRSWTRDLVERITMGVLAGGLLLSLLTFGLGLALWMLWLPLLVALWLWGWWAHKSHRVARIGYGSLRLDGLFAPRVRNGSGSPVTIDGHVGRHVTISADGVTLVDAEVTLDGPWTIDTLTWFAHAVAMRLGRAVEDHRPLDAWRAWEADPLERAAVQFDVMRADNADRYPTLFAQPSRSLPMALEHHGARIQVFRGNLLMPGVTVSMTHTHLTCGDQQIPLADIIRIGWLARDSTGMGQDADVVEMQVLTRDAWVQLFEIHAGDDAPWYASRLTWLTTEIADRVMDARRRAHKDESEGSATDVPEALARLRGAVRT